MGGMVIRRDMVVPMARRAFARRPEDMHAHYLYVPAVEQVSQCR